MEPMMQVLGRDYVVELRGEAAKDAGVSRVSGVVHYYTDHHENLVMVRYDGVLVTYVRGTWREVREY